MSKLVCVLTLLESTTAENRTSFQECAEDTPIAMQSSKTSSSLKCLGKCLNMCSRRVSNHGNADYVKGRCGDGENDDANMMV